MIKQLYDIIKTITAAFNIAIVQRVRSYWEAHDNDLASNWVQATSTVWSLLRLASQQLVSNSNVAHVCRCRRLWRTAGRLPRRRRRRQRRHRRRCWAACFTHAVVEQLLDAVLTWAQTCLHTITIARHPQIPQLSSPVYTIPPVVKPCLSNRLYNPVWQPVGCLFTRYSRLSNPLYNRIDNRLYRVNGVSQSAPLDNKHGYIVTIGAFCP